MNICISTLHKTNNSGSFWQAKALELVIEKLGHSAYFYDVKYTKNASPHRRYINLCKTLVHQGFHPALRQWKSMRAFSACRKGFKSVNDRAIEKMDLFILGSDTIWNIESPNLAANMSVFWGNRFFPKKVITYAASAGNAPLQSFQAYPALPETISHWQAVSVRDAYTRDILAQFTDREIAMVCDPTLLLEKADYIPMTRNVGGDKYIFLYLFAPLPAENARELVQFARENGLKIIRGTVGDSGLKVDRTIINSPYEFLSYMLHAEYIVTDTFHGTIFSTNLEKRYAAINRGKNKVNNFLEQVQLTDHLVGEGMRLTEVLTREIDYGRVRENLRAQRGQSMDYLKKALDA